MGESAVDGRTIAGRVVKSVYNDTAFSTAKSYSIFNIKELLDNWNGRAIYLVYLQR